MLTVLNVHWGHYIVILFQLWHEIGYNPSKLCLFAR